ncbi:MAG: ABC transporter transmembrane domain-containing protein [SAR324 cluster bacterium]|nr:ABC transporter transmembrane domain-containing protein [SAR324 cluster bacterium]
MPEINERPSKNLKILLSIFKFVLPYKLRVTFAGIALVCTAGISLSLGQGIRILFDQGFVVGTEESLGQAIGILYTMVLLLACGTFIRFYLVSWIGERVTADIRNAVFKHVIELHPSYFEINKSSEIQSRITTDTTLLQSLIGTSVSLALRNTLMCIGGIIFLFFTNAKLTMYVMIAVPLVIFPILFFGRRVRKLSKSSLDEIAHVGSFVGESLQNIKTVQGYNHQELDILKFSDQVELAFKVAIKRISQRSYMTAVVMLLVFSAIVFMIWMGGKDVLSGGITPGELFAFIFYSVIVGSSVGAVSQVIGELQRAAGATERLMELLQAKNLILPPEQNKKNLDTHITGAIELKNISFAYSSRLETPAIQNLSLSVEAGKSLALVGPSGGGKTTLFELLLRFYDAQEGAILFDNINIRDLDPKNLRKHIAIVPQQPALFSANVWENIQYGNPNASKEQIHEAAKAAYATEFIEQLPEQYDTYLGESGVRLSGGQRQRIAIARAILKNPEILLLDEATSALDAQSEQMVQMALDHLMVNRTTLIIAHRLATVKNVDQIAVIEAGNIVGLGTHEELVNSSPLYSRLAKLQFRGV